MKTKLLKISESSITKKIIALLLVVTLTMVDFVLLGTEMISYAVDALNEETPTNNKNVTFDSYFKDAVGNITSSKKENIDSDNISLYLKIAVKNEGYFNGTVTIDKSNFKLKNEVLSSYINKIEGNTITLNQINSGEIIELELGIEPIKDDTISSGLLSMSSEISINGIYRDSTERDIKISATRQVTLDLASPYVANEGLELNSSIITNKVYEINGQNKRIVEVLVESGLIGNKYPVKENDIEVSVPQGVEEVEVIARGMLSSNGKNETEFGKTNWQYSENEGKVKISLKNTIENGTINWIKNGKDRIVVTYIMREDINPMGTDIVVKNALSLYDTDATVKEVTKSVKIEDEFDGIIGTGIKTEESSMYKGKLYSGENREYKNSTDIYFNSSKVGKKAEIEMSASTYEVAGGEIEANIQLTRTVINKDDLTRILGEDGRLTITSQGNIIATITKEIEADENGNIVVNYEDGIKTITVETTEAIAPGTIRLNNVKTIKEDGNSKETKRAYIGIKERISGAETSVELKETETKVELGINKEKLSTLSVNENVEMTVTLKTDNEKYDLFKNPTFEIVMPQTIKTMNIKTLKPLYADMFQVADATVIDGSKTIRISLEGEQKNHTSEVNQTTIVIAGDIEFETLTPSNEAAIVMNYTNENGIEKSYSGTKNINIESKYGLMMNTTMEGYNDKGDVISTIDDQIVKGNLDVESNSKIARVKETVINNYNETMENVSVIARIPTKGINDGTIDTTLAELVKTFEGRVLYTTDANAKSEDGTWIENSEGAKAFKIELGSLGKGAKVEIEYAFVIPENIEYGQSLFTKVETVYTYLGNQMIQTSTLGAETENLTGVKTAELKESVVTNLDNGLSANIGATTAGKEIKDGDSVYEGQSIEYTVQITNKTGRNLNNVNISVEQENGTMYGLKDVEVFMDAIPIEGEDYTIEHRYAELDTNSRDFSTIENFENGKTIQFKYEIVANEVENNNETKGNITVKADNFEDIKFETISNRIEQAELKLNYEYRFNEEVQLYYGQPIQTIANITNLSGKDLNNIKATVRLPEGTYCTERFYDSDRNTGISNVKYNEQDNTITFEITELKANSAEHVLLLVDVKEFNQNEKGFSFILEANTNDDKIYHSNVMTKIMNNIEKNVTLTQESNIEENAILTDEDEIIVTINANNNSNTNLKATIKDNIPEQFTVTEANIDINGETKELPIFEYSDNDQIDNSISSSIINNMLVSNESLNANKQIKITLRLKLNTYSAEDIKNVVTMEYGELNEEDGYFKYTETLQSEKLFNAQIEEPSEEVKLIEINQTSNIENKSTLKNGQEILYKADVKNISNNEIEFSIRDALPKGIEVKSVAIDGTNVQNSISEEQNRIDINNLRLSKGQGTEITILANYNSERTASEELTNVVTVEMPEDTTKSNPITYYTNIDEDEDSPEEETTTGNNVNQNDRENDIREDANTKYTISGIAWLDENKNGQKEQSEQTLSGITVKVIDTDTGTFMQENGTDIETVTSSNGYYSFNIQRGNYVVVFMYDSNKYALTQYQKPGVSDKNNSDVISRTINNVEVASTDTIKLISEDIENIDAGLLENTKFDFELSKYISEVTVRTSKGVNTYNYDNAELAKVEIHAKELNNANVIIKYTIRVTNNGEIAGYVKDITDYMPSSLTFNSELNTDWYQADKNLHNTRLLNTKLGAGETKDITLTLTKTMTESNTGLISNLAELTDVNNEAGVQDLDSTPGNKAQGEDDLGKADIIISVKTGALVMYVGIVIAILVIIGLGAFVVNKKVLKDNNLKDIEF